MFPLAVLLLILLGIYLILKVSLIIGIIVIVVALLAFPGYHYYGR